MNRWWNGAPLPKYLKQARIVALSKDGTERPSEGDIRTIAIVPQLTKVYETIVHRRIEDYIQANQLIHPTQRGFAAGKSTAHNLHDFMEFMTMAKDWEKRNRAAKVKVKDRVRTFALFYDLRKTFDAVPRSQLLKKMKRKGFSN